LGPAAVPGVSVRFAGKLCCEITPLGFASELIVRPSCHDCKLAKAHMWASAAGASSGHDPYDDYDFYSSEDDDYYYDDNRVSRQSAPPPRPIASTAVSSASSSKWVLAHVKVPSSVVGLVIGKSGANLKRTQEQHKVRCNFLDMNRGQRCDVQRGANCLHIVGPEVNVKSGVASINRMLR
jgi:hypothetical protein